MAGDGIMVGDGTMAGEIATVGMADGEATTPIGLAIMMDIILVEETELMLAIFLLPPEQTHTVTDPITLEENPEHLTLTVDQEHLVELKL